MTKRRDKTQVAAEILNTCIGGSKMTKILRLANLQYFTFHKHVDPLVREKFLRRSPANTKDKRTFWIWETTPEGRIFQRQLEEINRKIAV